MKRTKRRKDWRIQPATLNLFRGPGLCEMCGRYCMAREPHHIAHKGMGGARTLDASINLVSLGAAFYCPCHTMYHNTGEIQPEDFVKIVARRERQTVEAINAAVGFLLTLPRQPWISDIRAGLEALDGAARELAERCLKEVGL